MKLLVFVCRLDANAQSYAWHSGRRVCYCRTGSWQCAITAASVKILRPANYLCNFVVSHKSIAGVRKFGGNIVFAFRKRRSCKCNNLRRVRSRDSGRRRLPHQRRPGARVGCERNRVIHTHGYATSYGGCVVAASFNL